MSKEIIYASLAGSILGLVIAFGVWRTNAAFKSNNKVQSGQTTTSSPSPAPSNQFDLSIVKPLDEDLQGQTPVTLSGVTKPNSWIIVSGEKSDYLIEAGNDGTFNQDVDLISGVNQLVITAFDVDGSKIEKDLNIVYSTELSNQAK